MGFIESAEQAITDNASAFYSDPLVSNCCGAPEKEDQDTSFCGECKEGCTFISEFDFATQGGADPVPDYVPEHGKTWYLVGRADKVLEQVNDDFPKKAA